MIGLLLLASTPPAFQHGGWQTVCNKGRDEFAVDCKAQLKLGSVTVDIRTGDSQLYVSSDGVGCRGDAQVGWRDKLLSLQQGKRLGLVRHGLTELTAHCSDPIAKRAQFRFIPDIASASEDMLR